jgi:two-component system, chemotaxis family, CheB/CheR fusion protein
MLRRQVGQMSRLVDDLLDLSRITRGRIDLRKERIELAVVVEQAVEAVRALHRSKNQELTIALPRQPVLMNADPARLAQVIGNLLNNACKFTDENGHVWLTAEQEGTQAVVRVRDSGIGIAAEHLPGLFEMFSQVDTSLERSRDGLGIGLTLVKTLVEMHDGTVEARSEGLGRGAEFTVRLPAETGVPVAPSPPVDVAPVPAGSRRILIVDDNEDGAESLALLLDAAGHETHIALDGLAAMEAAERLRPDAVLLDIGLPRLNGYEVGSRIRRAPWGKTLVLVALTGWGQDEDRNRSREAGFDAHMVKPVNFDLLLKFLNSVPPSPDSQSPSKRELSRGRRPT